MSFNRNHPECLHDEIFITNADDYTYKHIGWKTKRKGIISYMRNGEPCGLGWPGSFPVFVKRWEIEQKDPNLIASIERMNKDT